ncbi:MAG: multicopper oxidase domain-containing protein, partial [Bradymonadaceae bacterium]
FVNSFHTHSQFFDYYDHGTSLEPDRATVDTIMQTQAERGIVEVQYDTPGDFMFHAHQSEFAELGWMGKFNVVPPDEFSSALEKAGVGPEWDRRATQGSTVSSG